MSWPMFATSQKSDDICQCCEYDIASLRNMHGILGGTKPLTHCPCCGYRLGKFDGDEEQTKAMLDACSKDAAYFKQHRLLLLFPPANLPPDPFQFSVGNWWYRCSVYAGALLIAAGLIYGLSWFDRFGPVVDSTVVFITAVIVFFVGRYLLTLAKIPCPHCKGNLGTMYVRNRGRWINPLMRNFIHRVKDGQVKLKVMPRHCPFCGKDIDEPVIGAEEQGKLVC